MKPEMLQLAVYALATYPLAFAQITEMVTGTSPKSPDFQSDWTAFLEQMGSMLAEHAEDEASARAHPSPA